MALIIVHTQETGLLNLLLRNASYTAPSAIYMGLFSVAPGANSSGTEITGNAYARQAATFSAASSGGASIGSTITTSADIIFPVMSPSGYTPVAWGLFDASSAGNLLVSKAETFATFSANGQIRVLTGNLTFTMQGA